MLNQTLNDAQIVAGIDNQQQKNHCVYNCEVYPNGEKPLLLMCTQYLAVDDKLKWNVFLSYVRTLGLKVDRQFYANLRKIYEQIFTHCQEEDLILLESQFGKPAEGYQDNQLQEIFFMFSKCSPFNNDARTGRFLKIGAQLEPENLDDRSTVVAVQLFRKFFLQYADYNFKQPNPFHIIKNSNAIHYDTTVVREKIVNILIKNEDFLNYIEKHTSLFQSQSFFDQQKKSDLQKEILMKFLIENTDLHHFIIMVYDLLNKVTEGEFNSTLILKHISLQILDPFIHPLALSICDFYEQILEEEYEGTEDVKQMKEKYLPKITFLNMDGYDSEFNYKLLDNYSDSCQYISVLDEMLDSDDKSQMFDLVTKDRNCFMQAKNSYIIPIRQSHKQKRLNDMHFRHILDLLVYPLIKSFQPQVIIFSYSFAYFNQESDIQLSSKLFTEITTHLSLISNYKVIFLPRILSSGVQIQDHRFEIELLKTDHKNILYYLNIYLTHAQQSFKFLHPSIQQNCELSHYANYAMKIVKSNSFYEKKKQGNITHYVLNKEKERYMFEILSGFLESCRKSYLQEVKDKDKRMQDPNLQCQDLLQYKLSYANLLDKLYQFHQKHLFSNLFKSTQQQIHTYKLLSKQHQKTQRREDSQFVSFLAQDLKDYIYVIENLVNDEPQLLQIYLRRLQSPVYIHNRLTQYFVNYKLKTILFINVLSFIDIRDIGIDSYQVCLVNYEQYLNTVQKTNQIWAEIQVIHETTEPPVFFRSLCFDKLKNNIYCIYGKEAKNNTLCDSIDTYNFEKQTYKTIYRDKNTKKESDTYFARAYASSAVFSFGQQQKTCSEVWTFGGSFLGHYNQEFQNMGFCNLVERLFISEGSYRSEKINKELIVPLSMRPMYGSLMLSVQDNDESAILIIGGSQNELLVNMEQQEYIGYKFQQIDNQYYVSAITNRGQKINPISFYSQNQNIYSVQDKIYILNDATQILGKSYRWNNETNELEETDPFSPYGILSITTLKISNNLSSQEIFQKKKISIISIDAKNVILNGPQVEQPFAQMHKAMKFLYKEQDNVNYQARIIFQDNNNNEIVGLIKNFQLTRYIYLYVNIKQDENVQQGYLKPCSICVSYSNKSLYLLTTNIENGFVYFTIYSYQINQLIQDINLSLNKNNTKLVLNVYTIFAKVVMHLPNNVEKIFKQLTCDNENLYLIGGYMGLIYQQNDLDLILLQGQQTYKYHKHIENGNNNNFKIPFDNPEQNSTFGQSNKYMYEFPYIIWTAKDQILIIEKEFKQKFFSEVIDRVHHDFKIWITKFEIQMNESWEQGILVLPSFLLTKAYVEMTSQVITDKLKEQIQHRKLDLFLQNTNTEFETIVKIVDYISIDQRIILTCAVQVLNFIQMLSFEFSLENQEEYLLQYKYNGTHQQHQHARRYSVPIFIPKVTLLVTTQKQAVIEGYQIYDPVNEHQTIRQQNQSQIIVKMKEQIKVYNLIPQT
ncbi:hypothetical protein (macronuclear) [Paramecium tetraurelia strain d4-2]|uniref:Uncharacterized protein n=1 Tax=Paramecium tetraurelia TaxID=5888 RepID=Q6BFM2_PARTE|nr:hypothetical protein [Paramecium tetraurelia strain d4-2]CAH03548.1 hypothetical protein PTMB.351c [Paramecium tetraurelia]